MKPSRLQGVFAAGLSGLLLFTCSRPPERALRVGTPATDSAETQVSSNILREDYAGSGACAGCHAEIFEKWSHSPMRQMTRNATRSAIRAPFAGEVFEFKGDSAQMMAEDGELFVRVSSKHEGGSLYRVTRVIGGRYREDFVGIDVTGSADPAHAKGRGEERILPVSFIYSTGTWRYKGYSVLVKERPYLAIGGVWRKQCIFCHNTVPHLATLYDDLSRKSKVGYQGSMSNDLLPEGRRWLSKSLDGDSLKQALIKEIQFLDGEAPKSAPLDTLVARAISTTKDRFGPNHFIETGIGCEACHGGSLEHVKDPSRLPSYGVRSSALAEYKSSSDTPTRAEQINRTCMRCHTVLFSRYGPTWEGGHRYDAPGGSTINSGEARDFALGGCASQMSCTSCHSPHAEDKPADLEALVGPTGQALCTSCHQELRSPAAQAQHSHHDPEGPGGSCVACHMPKKNMGLDYRLTRYHRIGTPADAERIEHDRPIECALCHTSSSVESLIGTIEQWWGRRYDRKRLTQLYGKNLSVRPLSIALRYGKPHERAVALAALASADDDSLAPEIAEHLSHEYPLIRYYAAQSLQDLYGSWPDIDLDLDQTSIRQQAIDWLAAQESRHKDAPTTQAASP